MATVQRVHRPSSDALALEWGCDMNPGPKGNHPVHLPTIWGPTRMSASSLTPRKKMPMPRLRRCVKSPLGISALGGFPLNTAPPTPVKRMKRSQHRTPHNTRPSRP
jgi:hypothetical protein